MNSIYHFVMAWKDLIIKVSGDHPLAAAIVTILVVGMFFVLEKSWRPGKRPSNLLILLAGWSIAVPVLGLLLDALGKIWEFLEAALSILIRLVDSSYHIYAHHPFLVLGLVAAALLSYFAWKRWRPQILPNRLTRVVALATATVVAAHILAPIADIVSPSREGAVEAMKKSEPVAPASPTGVPPPQPVKPPPPSVAVQQK